MSSAFKASHTLGWDLMIQHPLQFVLAGLSLACVAIGLTYICWVVCRFVVSSRRQKKSTVAFSAKELASPEDIQRIATISRGGKETKGKKFIGGDSFGVFLGDLDESHVSRAQLTKIASCWDFLVLNAKAVGVGRALAVSQSTFRLARFDVSMMSGVTRMQRDDKNEIVFDNDINQGNAKNVVGDIINTMEGLGESNRFTGIVLAGWEEFLTSNAINALVKVFQDTSIYIETMPPHYIQESQASLQLRDVAGLIIKSGSMMPTATRRDFFKLLPVNAAIRMACKQTMVRQDFLLAMYNPFEGNATATNAELIRCERWCDYYSIKYWNGPEAALYDASFFGGKNKVPTQALNYLKKEELMDVQAAWVNIEEIDTTTVDDVETFAKPRNHLYNMDVPLRDAGDVLAEIDNKEPEQVGQQGSTAPVWQLQPYENSRFSSFADISPEGESLNGLGTFMLSDFPSYEDFQFVATTQEKLVGLESLDRLKDEERAELAGKYSLLAMSMKSSPIWADFEKQALDAIIAGLSYDPYRLSLQTTTLEIYRTLDTGMLIPAPDNGANQDTPCRFSGAFSKDAGKISLYVSRATQNLDLLVLHTALSSYGVPRSTCYAAEALMSQILGHKLRITAVSKRLEEEIAQLSPKEGLRVLQHLTRCPQIAISPLLEGVHELVRRLLLVSPSSQHLKALMSNVYLNGDISPRELMERRISWYAELGAAELPDPTVAANLFEEVSETIYNTLRNQDLELMADLIQPLRVIGSRKITMMEDIYTVCILCALRKWSLEEVLLEVTDRLPLFANQPDQAAVYSEMWVLGSDIESFFHCSSKQFGKVVYEKYRKLLREDQPPLEAYNGFDLFSAYQASKVDVDEVAMKKLSSNGTSAHNSFRAIAYFGVFAIPALIDVLLLTFYGKGLYISVDMGNWQTRMATLALLTSLVACGPITNFIGVGGSFYLYASTYATMVNFVLKRLISGLFLVAIGGLISFICIAVTVGVLNGLLFAFYFCFLSTYFICMGALCVLHWPDHPLPSGRTRIGYCLTILLLNPVLTSVIKGYDLAIYMSVLAGFTLVIAQRTFDLLAVWTMWLRECPTPDDQAVMEWYAKKHGDGDRHSTFAGVPVPTAMEIARTQLAAETDAEAKRRFWEKPTTDEFVAQLTLSRPLSVSILMWYSTYTRALMPLPYTSTWNLQLKVGLNTLRSFDKGLHPHNTFILWRHAKIEIVFGLLYFVLALLDRWVELFCGGEIIGLILLKDDTTRVAIAMALVGYLLGAVIMDVKVYPLYNLTQISESGRITSTQMLNEAQAADRKNRRVMYVSYFSSVMLLACTGFGICGTLVWLFVPDIDGIAIFFTYTAAYIGLLWYQYNRVFAAHGALAPSIVAILIGFAVGIPLRLTYPNFEFADVISLNCATWSAAFMSLFKTKILPMRASSSKALENGDDSEDSDLSEEETLKQDVWAEVQSLADSQQTKITLTYHDANEVASRAWETLRYTVEDQSSAVNLDLALPQWRNILVTAADRWYNKSLSIVLVSASDVSTEAPLSFPGDSENTGIIIIPTVVEESEGEPQTDIPLPSEYELAAILATETARLWFGYNKASAEKLVVALFPGLNLSSSAQEQELVDTAALGLDVDTCWTTLPESMRRFIYARCESNPESQRSHFKEPATLEWLKDHCEVTQTEPRSFVARSNIHPATTRPRVYGSTTLASLYSRHHSKAPSSQYSANPSKPASVRSSSLSTKSSAKTKPAPTATYRHSFVHQVQPLTIGDRVVKIGEYLIARPLNQIAKFILVISSADPEFHREIQYELRDSWFRVPVVWVLSQFFILARIMHAFAMDRFIRMRRPHLKPLIDTSHYGFLTRISGDRISVEDPVQPVTGFIHLRDTSTDVEEAGPTAVTFQDGEVACIRVYKGKHAKMPTTHEKLTSMGFYGTRQRLLRRQMYQNGNLKAEYHFEYRNETDELPIRKALAWSEKKIATANNATVVVTYDGYGRLSTGQQTLDGLSYDFKYYYARKSDDVVKIDFECQDEDIRVEAYYGSKPRRKADNIHKWLPAKHLMKLAVHVAQRPTEVTTWSYDHNAHPTLTCTVEGNVVPTPKYASEDHFKLTKPPKETNYLEEDLVWGFRNAFKINRNRVSRFFLSLFDLDVRRTRLTTWKFREALWKKWKAGFDIDAAAAVHLDEQALRQEPLLKPYWRARDRGDLHSAISYLKKHVDAVEGATDLAPEVGGWTFLAIKMSNLFSMGPAGDMVVNTRSTETFNVVGKDKPSLHVLAADTGTWPTEGGGVSCCRRDMVDNLDRVKWHIIAEVANDLGMPRFQTTKNVQSVKLLAQWGLDFFTAHHGVLENFLDAQVEDRMNIVSDAEIEKNFVPILKVLVRGARTRKFTKKQIQELTQMLLDLNSYFEKRDWRQVWKSDPVRRAWHRFWLSDTLGENMNFVGDMLTIEQPTMKELDSTLDLYMRYMYVFSLQLPETVPTVFQTTHHSVGALYGILYKIKRGCTFQVWDHCVIWRESLGYLSSSLCSHAPFVQNSLIAMMRVSATLNLYHADVVLPCTNYFNPGWEVELGTEEGSLGARQLYRRKIDPIVNGICNMDQFEPIEKITAKLPTVTMLSHVQYVKDIKTTLLAADVIINEWQFEDYRLEIYGGLDRAPSYTVECQELLASKGLHGRVLFQGYGNPKDVLAKTWLFMNSSISEGLPLAIGEAALTGAPIVCTDVGATKLVLQDPDDSNKLYGEVILPNRPRDLARAQIEVSSPPLPPPSPPSILSFANMILTKHDRCWQSAVNGPPSRQTTAASTRPVSPTTPRGHKSPPSSNACMTKTMHAARWAKTCATRCSANSTATGTSGSTSRCSGSDRRCTTRARSCTNPRARSRSRAAGSTSRGSCAEPVGPPTFVVSRRSARVRRLCGAVWCSSSGGCGHYDQYHLMTMRAEMRGWKEEREWVIAAIISTIDIWVGILILFFFSFCPPASTCTKLGLVVWVIHDKVAFLARKIPPMADLRPFSFLYFPFSQHNGMRKRRHSFFSIHLFYKVLFL